MPKQVEDCVKKITGKNKRTGEPYTQSEKWAICKSTYNKKQKGASFSEDTELVIDEEVVAEVENSMDECVRKALSSGKAKTREDAKAMCEAMMAKSNFDPKQLWFVFNRELGG